MKQRRRLRPRAQIYWLGTYLVIVAIALVACLLWSWPEFVVDQTVPYLELRYLLIAAISGSLGATLNLLTLFVWHAQIKEVTRKHIWVALYSPVWGAALGTLTYLIVRGGLVMELKGPQLNPFGVASVAGLAGLFGHQVAGKLAELVEVVFETAALRAGEKGVQRRILIIEPDADQRAALKSFLAKSYTILEAEGPADGLAKVATETPDLLILERESKGVDGVEIVRKLRQNNINVPVILISRKIRRAQDRVEIISAGADECLERPVDVRILRLKIQSLLRRYEGLQDRFVSAPVEDSVTKTTERATTTSTTNLAYFYDRVQQEVTYAMEKGLRFAVLHVQVPGGGPAHQELCALVGTLIREYDLMYADSKRVAVLLGETDEDGARAFLNRLQERWKQPMVPLVGYKFFDRDENFLQTAKELIEATGA